MIIFFCRPFTGRVLAYRILPEHESAFYDRYRRGAFSARRLWETTPSLYREATVLEVTKLRSLGMILNVYEWCVTNDTVDRDMLESPPEVPA